MLSLLRRNNDRADEFEVEEIARSWVRACEGAGLVREVPTVSGTTVIPPKLTHVVLGPPRVLTVRLQPGMTTDDVRALAPRLAPHLSAYGLRVESRGLGEYAVITLLDSDPLAGIEPFTYRTDSLLTYGRSEDDRLIAVDPRTEGHTIAQGVTRSGKSVWTYGLLAQLARRPDVRIAGCDPTGLLWRPFPASPDRVSGLADIEAHENLLHRLVAEMDQRITEMPTDRDTVAPDVPLIFLVIEEYAGLLRAADAMSKDTGKRIRAHLSRLLAEGAKAGFRLLILVQRAEAAVIGAFERAMCSTRISFRCDNRASVELLHPGAPDDVCAAHSVAAPGVALLSTPGTPLVRLRAPYIGSYADYATAVRDAV